MLQIDSRLEATLSAVGLQAPPPRNAWEGGRVLLTAARVILPD